MWFKIQVGIKEKQIVSANLCANVFKTIAHSNWIVNNEKNRFANNHILNVASFVNEILRDFFWLNQQQINTDPKRLSI